MSSKSPSPTLSNVIFRPWQIESGANSDSNSSNSSFNQEDSLSKFLSSVRKEDSEFIALNHPFFSDCQFTLKKEQSLFKEAFCESSVQHQHSTVANILPHHSSMPSIEHQHSSVPNIIPPGSLMPRKEHHQSSVTNFLPQSTSAPSLTPPVSFKKKKITLIKSEFDELPKESNSSKSRNKQEDSNSLNVTSARAHKRSIEETTEEPARPRKMTKRDERVNYEPSKPNISSAMQSFLPGLPDPGALFFSPSQMFNQNPHFNNFVPMLEPQILIPAAEMERVCARRPRPKKFSCDECGAAFSNRGQLSGHCRIHTGERPYRCTHPSCGKRFTRNEELTRHRRIHSGLRPFACGICPKRFGRKDHLKKHLRTHARHVIPQLQPLPQYNPLHLQQLHHFHHLQQIQQQFHLQMPIMPLQNSQRHL